jgi:hypothetical protein
VSGWPLLWRQPGRDLRHHTERLAEQPGGGSDAAVAAHKGIGYGQLLLERGGLAVALSDLCEPAHHVTLPFRMVVP